MTAKRLRQRLEGLAARAVWALFAALGPDAASGLAGRLARTIGPRMKVSRVARLNLAQAFPERSAAEIEAIVADVWENLGRVAGEFPHVPWLAKNRVEVVNLDVLHRCRDDGAPGLFIGAHLGNWELGPAMAYREGMPITLVYRAANNPWVEDLYRKGRANAAQIAKGPEGARDILRALKEGGHLAILVDQKMNDGIAAPFFGREAMTAPAVARFAIKFGCPVVPVRIERLRGAHFRVTFQQPMEVPDTGDVHADTLTMMTAVNAQLEEWIRARPGQWLWLHRRWPE